jgi:cellulose synthase operon protein C
MSAVPLRRHLPPVVRSVVAILLYICAWQAFPPAYAGQSAAVQAPSEIPFLQAARQAIARGNVAEAEALAKARPAGDADAAAVLASIAIRTGTHDTALVLLEPVAAQPQGGEAALHLGLIYQQLGRSEAATRLLEGVYRQAGPGGDAESTFRAARAAQALGRAQEANALYRAAAAASDDPSVDVAWGFLFHEKYNPKEALTSFQDAVKADPLWAPAHLGVGQVLSDENPPAAAAAARRALEIDPQLAGAHVLLAELELDNARTDEARKHLEAVLAFNPSHLHSRALLGAIAYIRGDTHAYEAEVQRVLALNPAYGDVYRVASDLSARNYRFEEAVALARQAVALDPANSRAYAELGMHLMRTGDEAEARRSLDRSFSGDPFNRVTWNLLALLDTLDKFVVEKQDDLILKLHPDEAPVLREYAMPLAREALAALSARYQFTPKGPILIEIFPNHDDFAVRTLGLPGMLGALGACFGRVVTMDSPKAKEPGTFAWQATLWHELAHVITLQMSNQRVPRWLTEGISVFEETRARPEWGRDMEVPFAQALTRGEVLELKDLNAGFTRPETIALAYYQASLLVDHIVATHGGQAALQRLLKTYGAGVEGDAAISKALDISIDQLQGTFDQMLQSRFGALQAALKAPERGAVAGGQMDLAGLEAAAAAHPGSFVVQLALGQALAAAGDRAAFEPLERAAALVPMATGEDSPHALMARLAEQLGDTPRAVTEYQALLAHDHAAVEPARRLAALAEKAGDEKAAAVAYNRIVAVDPFDPQAHTGAGRIALKRADSVVAAREFRVALLTGAPDKAAAHCDLGESYLLAGKAAEAKKEALAALEIAPTFERAQDLLLRAVEKDVGRSVRDQPAKEAR